MACVRGSKMKPGDGATRGGFIDLYDGAVDFIEFIYLITPSHQQPIDLNDDNRIGKRWIYLCFICRVCLEPNQHSIVRSFRGLGH